MSLRLHGQRGGVLATLLALALGGPGCTAPAPEPRKELFVEPVAGEPGATQAPLEPFPLDPRQEGALFVTLRTLRGDRQQAVELLARTLDVWPPPPDAPGANAPPAPVPPTRPDLSEQARQPRPPALMFFPVGSDQRADSACYLGHCAFAVRGYGRPAVLHHVRFQLVNAEPHALRIPLDSLRCEALAALGGEDGEVLQLDRRAVADDRGQEVDEMLVEAGQTRTWHLFFHSRRLDHAIRLFWRVEAAWPPDEEPRPAGPWEMQVGLARRYVLQEPLFTELEQIVARGDPLPHAPRGYDPFREPLMEPVPAPPD